MLRGYHALAPGAEPIVAVGRHPPESSMLDVEFAQISDVGQIRDHNEDSVGHVLPATPEQARSHGWLFALADGVGGHEHGEVASQAAVESLIGGFRSAADGEPLMALLPRLVQAANAHVFETGHSKSPSGSAMATTVVACALRYDRAVVAHVGDSRCYLVRRGHATPLTRDHTLANEQARLGLISPKEASQADHSHILSRSIGADLFVSVDASEHQVFSGDLLVLCSDGLHGSVSASDIARLLSHEPDLNSAAQQLVALANERDGSDNISVQLIRVRGVERVGMYRGRPYKLR
jgi:PPM family protein phosphatase